MKQEKYVIGLDLGINNVGWSILNIDTEKIEKNGVRLFNPSDTAEKRRVARSVRRRNKREKNRINDSIKLLKSIDFPTSRRIDENLVNKRVKGLNEQISEQDIVNIICYFMSHRGYIPYDDEELNFVDLNGMYPCEYYQKLYNDIGKYRGIDENVKHIELYNELKKILDTQSNYYKNLITIKENIFDIFSRKREFWEGPGSITSFTKYGRFKNEEDVNNYLKNKDINSNYEKYLFEDLINNCEVYMNEKCAPKSSFYAQKYNLLNDFINLTINDKSKTINKNAFIEEKNGYKFNDIGLKLIIDYCLNHDANTLKIDNLFKTLFNIKKENIEGFRKDKKDKIEISTFDEWRALKRVASKYDFDTSWLFDVDNINIYDKLIYYINVSPSGVKLFDMVRYDTLIGKYINNESYDFILDCFKTIKNASRLGYHSLSKKALIRACNDMISTQMNFQQVRKKFDYDKEKREYFAKQYIKKNGRISLTENYIDNIIASPQVKKTLRQSIKIINAIIEEKKALPYCIAIESTKEMNGKDKKKEIINLQKKKEELRKNAQKIIENNGKEVTDNLIERVMLYQEIDGRCPYCNEQKISIKDVLNSRVKIEHILPISKSMDNSYENKTLSCEKCNDNKSNKTPYYWKKTVDYDDFAERIRNNNLMSDEKKQHFLFEGDIDKYSLRFFNRNLRDTAYATKELIKQINLFNYFLNEQFKLQIKTLSTPGQITHKIRQDNNLEKNRDDGKYHHAVDAAIVASIANTKIGEIIIDSQNNNKFWLNNKNKINNISELLNKVNIAKNIDEIKKISNDNIKLSSQVLKKSHGSLSNANIVKYINVDGNKNIISQINNIYEEKNTDLEKYFDDNATNHLMIRDNNPKLYEQLKNIFNEYKDEKGNAFKNYCFNKYKSDEFDDIKKFNIRKYGIKSSDKLNSPVVKKLRYYSKVSTPYLLEKNNINKKSNTLIGLDSLSISFVEIYYDIDKNKFAFLPIYSILIDSNTNKVNRNDKFYNEIKKNFLPNNNYQYICKVCNGNIMKVQKKNGIIIDGCYSTFDKSERRIKFKNASFFTESDLSFTLYDVDILGNRKERLTFSLK